MPDWTPTWIVITGALVDSTRGGGFEFWGPFSSSEDADAFRVKHMKGLAELYDPNEITGGVFLTIQLLTPVEE